ncbi:hypothetical protein Hdeb2414_s0015g00448281 [Helianthus debilis subsp. tardiflorus]
MICEELAANEDPIKTLYSVMGKEAYMGIQLQRDMKMRALKCVVTKLNIRQPRTLNQFPLVSRWCDKTPHPTTPAQKANTELQPATIGIPQLR